MDDDEDDRSRWFLGLDWGSAEHRARLTDWRGREMGTRRVAHTGEALGQLCDWVLETTGAEPQQIRVAIETPTGPVVEHLLERGFRIFAINPKQSDRFRDRFSPAGAKDDARDTEVLGSALRTDPQAFREVKASPAQLVELKEWSRIHKELVAERTRLTHQIRAHLWRYYPQMTEVADGDVGDAWVMELWALAPTPEKGAKLRKRTIEALLKRRRIRRIKTDEVMRLLKTRPINSAPGTAEAAQTHIRLTAARLDLVRDQIKAADAGIDRLMKDLPYEEASPGQPHAHRDAEILSSLPGAGRIVSAGMLAEAWELLQRRDYHALRCLSGVAPVTKGSGKSIKVQRRHAANPRLADTVYNWARCSAQSDPLCQARYKALRARGHSHARAIRAIADRLLATACAMLRTQTDYDPSRAGVRPPAAAPTPAPA
jgi:hypothetical protein